MLNEYPSEWDEPDPPELDLMSLDELYGLLNVLCEDENDHSTLIDDVQEEIEKREQNPHSL